MRRKSIFFLVFILLIGISLNVSAATNEDFVKLQVEGKKIFTHKDLVNSRYIVGSDKIFYGSSEGQITMKLYLSDKISSGDYKIGLRTKSKNITIKSIGVGKSPVPVLSVASKQYDYPEIIKLNNSLTEVTIVLEFDPNEIGALEEFDVILYNDKGETIVVYDPFISGFGFRQIITLDTSELTGNVDLNHTLPIFIDSTNTDFWENQTFNDGNGVDFYNADSTVNYDFVWETFDSDVNEAIAQVEITDTFDATVDSDLTIYFKGSDTDNTDGSDAFPDSYMLSYFLNETSGTQFDGTSNNNDLTTINVVTQGSSARINGGDGFDGAADFVHTSTESLDIGTSDYSVVTWSRPEDNSDESVFNIFANNSTEVFIGYSNTVSDNKYLFQGRTTGDATAPVKWSATSTLNNWHFVVGRRISNTIQISVDDGIFEGSATGDRDIDPATEIMLGVRNAHNIDFFNGQIDGVRVMNYALSQDEVKLLFLADSNNLIVFGQTERFDFTVSLNPGALDPENSFTSITATLTATSSISLTITDWNYFIDSVQFYHSTVDGDTTREFNDVGDFNISLIITDDNSVLHQKDVTVNIFQAPQSIAITPETVEVHTNTNYTLTWSGDLNILYIDFDGDSNRIITGNPSSPDSTIFFDSNVSGVKTIIITAQLNDYNKTVTRFVTVAPDITPPVIEQFDINSVTGFGITGTLGYTLRCTDNLSPTIDYNVTNNSVSQYSNTDTNNQTVHLNNRVLNTGTNEVTFRCTDSSGNFVTDTNTFAGASALFFLVFNNTGVGLTGAADYVTADINTFRVYSANLQTFIDLKATGDVNVAYSGIGDDSLVFVATYTNQGQKVSITQDFDIASLDTNSIPVCFAKIQPFFEQLLFSTSIREIKIQNSLTGCFHAMARTDYAHLNAFKLSVFTIPGTYTLSYKPVDSNSYLILSSLSGNFAASHNLDLMIINSQGTPQIVVSEDVLTANRFCQISDCNVLSISYTSPVPNSSVTIQVLNGSTVLVAETVEGADSNSVNFTWDFTTADVDSDSGFLTLKAIITRTNGTQETITQLFTLRGIQGFLDPGLAIMLAFGLFFFVFTVVASRFALGWIGIIAVIVSLVILSTAPGTDEIRLAQVIMIVIGIFIFFTWKNETAKAI